MSDDQKQAFSKASILRSTRYTPQQKDILRVILKDDATYTHGQVQYALSNFLKREAE